ncbi:MAG: hypothetical protein LUC93_03120 [Planctomycetaceae bacterium]|nr:hypothetical protein [Planctomycetaceae bacterium]
MTTTRQELIAEAREMIGLYTKAERAVLLNQSYSIAGQTLTRADLDKVRAGRQEWENRLNTYIGQGKMLILNVRPMDY